MKYLVLELQDPVTGRRNSLVVLEDGQRNRVLRADPNVGVLPEVVYEDEK